MSIGSQKGSPFVAFCLVQADVPHPAAVRADVAEWLQLEVGVRLPGDRDTAGGGFLARFGGYDVPDRGGDVVRFLEQTDEPDSQWLVCSTWNGTEPAHVQYPGSFFVPRLDAMVSNSEAMAGSAS